VRKFREKQGENTPENVKVINTNILIIRAQNPPIRPICAVLCGGGNAGFFGLDFWDFLGLFGAFFVRQRRTMGRFFCCGRTPAMVVFNSASAIDFISFLLVISLYFQLIFADNFRQI